MQYKRVKKPINGIILLDKPLGYSSNQALQKVKHLFQAAKAGHTGTLDPLATGLLPLCFGEATKFSHYLTDANKTYIATIKLGQTTTTGDAEGEILSDKTVLTDLSSFKAICSGFVGEISQTPPMYSALKIDGKPLYEYAREGITLERKVRQVTIFDITLHSLQDTIAVIEVSCSKGTYIRTLAEDIGNAIGCGAHLIGLRRIKTAHFTIGQTVTLEQLEAVSIENRFDYLHPIDSALDDYPVVIIDDDNVVKLLQGQKIYQKTNASYRYARLYTVRNEFLGLGEQTANGTILPKRLIQQDKRV